MYYLITDDSLDYTVKHGSFLSDAWVFDNREEAEDELKKIILEDGDSENISLYIYTIEVKEANIGRATLKVNIEPLA